MASFPGIFPVELRANRPQRARTDNINPLDAENDDDMAASNQGRWGTAFIPIADQSFTLNESISFCAVRTRVRVAALWVRTPNLDYN